jgi:branched-chain amino acid transport system substrate-binding protein
MRRGRVAVATVLAGLVGLPALLTAGSTPAVAAPAPITIAFVLSQTGPGAPSLVGAANVFRARIDLQNAQGGVNGHRLIPLVIDDQTSPTAVVTAIQEAISKGALGIVSGSFVFQYGAKYPQQAGIPVTGDSSDGPEWGTQPYTNMFASDFGSLDPKYPVNTVYGKILKTLGGTRLATYGYGISPDSARHVFSVAQSFQRVGGSAPVQDASIPFGGVDFTSAALAAKDKNINAVWPNLLDASNYAIAQALQQAGVKVKVAVFPTGYDPAIIGSPVWSYVQGDYFVDIWHPSIYPNAGTRVMQAALIKYAHWTKSQFPTFGQGEAWLGADLMIKGIQRAGTNPTSAKVIKALRGIKAYNGNGLLATSINYSTIFGHDPTLCFWLFKAASKGFVPYSQTPFCGTDIPGTSTAKGS